GAAGAGARGLRRRGVRGPGPEFAPGGGGAPGGDRAERGGRGDGAAPVLRAVGGGARRAYSGGPVGRRPAALPRRRAVPGGLRGRRGRGPARAAGQRARAAVHALVHGRPGGVLRRGAYAPEAEQLVPGAAPVVVGRDGGGQPVPRRARPAEGERRPEAGGDRV